MPRLPLAHATCSLTARTPRSDAPRAAAVADGCALQNGPAATAGSGARRQAASAPSVASATRGRSDGIDMGTRLMVGRCDGNLLTRRTLNGELL
ncbi:hypothetical protein rosag_00280 [Roseisolibacter agri]|uniref:Uncharacterized protein n=1 Tax=Roseisolibacter agri TaxID=2014610 RepID=A0AA37V017_9BACT|nr:hypothetical protein rosag_00280 [Roseisolibacter agri]